MEVLEIKTIESKIIPITEAVKMFVIDSQENLELANNQRKIIKALIKEVTDTFSPIKKKTHDAWKEAVAQEKRHLEPLEIADKKLSNGMGNYLMLEEKRKAEEEAKRLEAIRKEQEKTLEKAAKKIENLLGKSTDIQAQIDSLKEALNQSVDDTEATALRSKLEILMVKKNKIEEGIQAKTQEVEQVKFTPPPIVPVHEKSKVSGMGFRTKKEGEVIDKMAVIKAVAQGMIPLDLLEVNQGVLNRLLNAGMTIYGVRVTEVPIVSTRR